MTRTPTNQASTFVVFKARRKTKHPDDIPVARLHPRRAIRCSSNTRYLNLPCIVALARVAKRVQVEALKYLSQLWDGNNVATAPQKVCVL